MLVSRVIPFIFTFIVTCVCSNYSKDAEKYESYPMAPPVII